MVNATCCHSFKVNAPPLIFAPLDVPSLISRYISLVDIYLENTILSFCSETPESKNLAQFLTDVGYVHIAYDTPSLKGISFIASMSMY
jgi:hypothetical protein